MRKSPKGLSGIKTKKVVSAKAKKRNLSPSSSIVPSIPEGPPVAITRAEYDAWQKAFEYLNEALFDGTLPNVAIVFSRRAHSGGHFAPDRFTYRSGNGEREHELSLNPDGFEGRSSEWIVSILLHEMCHLWQHMFGTKKRAKYNYHDREWGRQMEALGLMPSTTGMIGGRKTGQKMSHYVLQGGLYQRTFEALEATGWEFKLQSTAFAGRAKAPPSKVKFTCPTCQSNMWGKPDSHDACPDCDVWRVAEGASSYDQAAE